MGKKKISSDSSRNIGEYEPERFMQASAVVQYVQKIEANGKFAISPQKIARHERGAMKRNQWLVIRAILGASSQVPNILDHLYKPFNVSEYDGWKKFYGASLDYYNLHKQEHFNKTGEDGEFRGWSAIRKAYGAVMPGEQAGFDFDSAGPLGGARNAREGSRNLTAAELSTYFTRKAQPRDKEAEAETERQLRLLF